MVKPGVTPDDELVIKLAFMLAREIRGIANQARTEAQNEAEAYWRRFLQKNGQAGLYRKSAVERGGILLEGESDNEEKRCS